MNKTATLFLRIALILIGLAVFTIYAFGIPFALAAESTGYYSPILLGLYAPVIPFFYALYQTFKLLHYIDHNTAFSGASVRSLQRIKYCALIIGVIFTAGLPYIYYAAKTDDAPGVFAIGLILVFASAVVAVFAAVLQELLRSAIAIKSENDLTV